MQHVYKCISSDLWLHHFSLGEQQQHTTSWSVEIHHTWS